MPPPTREEVNALIAYLNVSQWRPYKEAASALTALQAENDRLRAQASPAWVALSELKPTKEDADEDGYILIHGGHGPTGSTLWNNWNCDRTHWMRLPAPPESAADRQRREDEEALDAEWSRHAIGGDTGRFANFSNGFRAALAHARKEATP